MVCQHEVESCEKRHSMSVTRGPSRLGGFCEKVAEVMDAEAGREDEMYPSKKNTSGGTISKTRPA